MASKFVHQMPLNKANGVALLKKAHFENLGAID